MLSFCKHKPSGYFLNTDILRSPPLSFYSRKPTIFLPDLPRRTAALDQAEKGQVQEDDLDRHVEDILSKKDKWKRIMRGVWAFMKTREFNCGVIYFSY